MMKFGVAVALLILGGCAGVPGAPEGQLASACNVARPGPCYDGKDITDRTNRDDQRDVTPRVAEDLRDVTVRVPDDQRDITPHVPGDLRDITDRRNPDDRRDITPHVPDDQHDITDRRNRDDTTDRSVWCDSAAMAIEAPSFMVFFDWDRSDLSPQAVDTLKAAANAYRTKGGARVTAIGHTDRSGSETYNMALSLRRANTVKDALVHDGVQASDISVVGRGEAQPLIPTVDGVRESQNRRVEIVIR